MYFSRKNKRKSIPRCLTTPTSKFLTFSQVLCQFIVAYYTWFLALLPPHCLSHNRHCKCRVKSKRRCISRLHVSPFRFPGQFQAQQYTLVLHVSHKYKFASTVSSVPTPAFILLIIGCVKIAQKEKPM